jgi:polyhydroxybutyrate depolymerase
MRKIWLLLLPVLLTVVVLSGGATYLLWMNVVDEPELPGTLVTAELQWDGQERSYTYYRPLNLAARPPLIFVFHGSGGSSQRARGIFGYAFEELAEQHGFLVVFPQGYEKHFNGCRKAGPYAANTENIDDVGYLRALVDLFAEQDGIDRQAVFATGISNGGQMALRLALEAPDLVAAVAPVATSMPS